MQNMELQKLKTEAEAWPVQVQGLPPVTDDAMLLAYDDKLKAIRALAAQVRAASDEIIKKAHDTWKTALAKRDLYLSPLKLAEQLLKARMGPYMLEQARKQREAEEAARRAQEEAAAAARAAEEERQRKAREAAHDGDIKSATKILAAPPPAVGVPAVEVPKAAKLAGTSVREEWRWRITDEKLIPREWLTLNEPLITAHVRMHKGNTRIPGIEAYAEASVAVRST